MNTNRMRQRGVAAGGGRALEVVAEPPASVAGQRRTEAGPFVQVVRLELDGKVIAKARWHSAHSSVEGVIQILDFTVSASERRLGHGARLMREIIAQAKEYFRGGRLRRAWITVGHEHQVIARAFLTAQSYHHTGTIKDLLRDEDLLVYVRAFD